MAEHQENFDDILLNGDTGGNQTQPEPELEREVINCSMCEDSGACNYCARGRQWLADHPKPTPIPKKKNGGSTMSKYNKGFSKISIIVFPFIKIISIGNFMFFIQNE